MLNFKRPSILWNCWTLLFGSHSNSKGREYMWTITQNQLCLTISTYTASIHLKKMVFNMLPNSQGIYSLRSTLNPMPRPQQHTAESSEVALYSIHLSHCQGVYTHPTPSSGFWVTLPPLPHVWGKPNPTLLPTYLPKPHTHLFLLLYPKEVMWNSP